MLEYIVVSLGTGDLPHSIMENVPIWIAIQTHIMYNIKIESELWTLDDKEVLV